MLRCGLARKGGAPVVTEKDISQVAYGQTSIEREDGNERYRTLVCFDVNEDGQARLRKHTREHINETLLIDFNGVILYEPTIRSEIASRFIIVLCESDMIEEHESSLKEFEESSLADYVAGGGAIWADACCGSERFDESIRVLVPKIAGGARLAPLSADHPVYSVGYAVRKVRVCAEHRSTELSEAAPALEGAFIDGRLAVVYSRRSLGSTWRTYRFGLPCMMSDADGRRLSSNILLYFLTR